MTDPDLEFASPLIAEYYDWLSANGGRSLDELLALPMTARQKELFLQGVDDVELLWSITAPIREASAVPGGTMSSPN